jgi:hypothetical protein
MTRIILACFECIELLRYVTMLPNVPNQSCSFKAATEYLVGDDSSFNVESTRWNMKRAQPFTGQWKANHRGVKYCSLVIIVPATIFPC